MPERDNYANTKNSYVKKSYLWRHFKMYNKKHVNEAETAAFTRHE